MFWENAWGRQDFRKRKLSLGEEKPEKQRKRWEGRACAFIVPNTVTFGKECFYLPSFDSEGI